MATYINCPKCYARFQVPEGSEQATARCPKCRYAFALPHHSTISVATVTPRVGAPVAAGGGAAEQSAAAAAASGSGAAGSPGREEPTPREAFDFDSMEMPSRILSAADEAMLRELGSGTGLLEMTRGAMEDIPGGRSARGGGAAASTENLSDRQFQIVGTALTMANKLSEVYKAELARARRLSLLAWTCAAIVLMAAIGVSIYAVNQSGSAQMRLSDATHSDQMAANLQSQLSDEHKRSEEERALNAKVSAELDGQRALLAKAQADLIAAHDTASQSEVSNKLLTSDLREANARVAQLQTQLDAAKAAAATPASQPAAAAVPAATRASEAAAMAPGGINP